MSICSSFIPLFPGETAQHRFICPYASDLIQKVYVSYKQGLRDVFEKEASDIYSYDDENSAIDVHLTQEDTLRFKNGVDVTAQLNVMLVDGRRRTSEPVTIVIGEQYKREVIS